MPHVMFIYIYVSPESYIKRLESGTLIVRLPQTLRTQGHEDSHRIHRLGEQHSNLQLLGAVSSQWQLTGECSQLS